MSYKSNFNDLENQAKLSATKLIAETFQRYENLDKVGQLIKRYKQQEEATEAQLKLTIQSQLDNVKDGLEKLDSSFVECEKIKGRMDEISGALVNIRSLASGLEELQGQSKNQKQLSATMDNMDYLVNVPTLMKQAATLLEANNFLPAHKIIEELEATRDEIVGELYQQDSSESDLHVIDAFFRDLDNLNSELLRHLRWMGERVINACVTQNKVLVNCIRVIDREERIDEMWEKVKDHPLPSGRPKRWKHEFFQMVQNYINHKIFESALDEEQKKGFLPRHLEAIRCHTLADLKIIKNIGCVYFPPHYRVFDEFVKMYHEAISRYVQSKAEEILNEAESFNLLGWINHYHTSEFMGNPELGIDIGRLDVKTPNLLTPTEFEKVSQLYLDRQRMKLNSWFNNSIKKDQEDWESDQIPPVDGDSCYHTSLSSMTLQPLSEMIGRDKVLHYLGEKMREKYYPMFLNEFKNFQALYKKELLNYRDRYAKIEVAYKSEYLVANCNNCLRLESALSDMINHDLKTSPSIQVKIDTTLKSIAKEMFDIAQQCLDLILELMFMDLATVFSQLLSDDWIRQNYRVVDFVLGTVADYNNTFIFLKPAAHKRLIKATIRRVVVEYVKSLFTRHNNLNAEESKQVGHSLYYEGDKIIEFFGDKMMLDKQSIECAEVLKLIGQMLQNSDKTMMRLDIGTLVKHFPGIRKDQMIGLLKLRGDTSLTDAKEIAEDFSYCSSDDRTKIFQDVAQSMGHS